MYILKIIIINLQMYFFNILQTECSSSLSISLYNVGFAGTQDINHRIPGDRYVNISAARQVCYISDRCVTSRYISFPFGVLHAGKFRFR